MTHPPAVPSDARSDNTAMTNADWLRVCCAWVRLPDMIDHAVNRIEEVADALDDARDTPPPAPSEDFAGLVNHLTAHALDLGEKKSRDHVSFSNIGMLDAKRALLAHGARLEGEIERLTEELREERGNVANLEDKLFFQRHGGVEKERDAALQEIERLRGELAQRDAALAQAQQTQEIAQWIEQIPLPPYDQALAIALRERAEAQKGWEECEAVLLAQAAGDEWLPIGSAPKDLTPRLLLLKDPIPRDREDVRGFDGLQFVGAHQGLTSDGFDVGWHFAAPVGCGGIPDDWIKGWRPLPAPPGIITSPTPISGSAIAPKDQIEDLRQRSVDLQREAWSRSDGCQELMFEAIELERQADAIEAALLAQQTPGEAP